MRLDRFTCCISQFLQKKGTGGDIYSTLQVEPLPEKAQFSGMVHAPAQFVSHVPPQPAASQLAGLTDSEISQLQSERQKAEKLEEENRRLEEERAAAVARREYYTQALASLRVSQSKTTRSLVEAEQRLEMEKRECVEIELQYDKAYGEFSAEHAKVAPVLKALEEAEAEKSSLLSKKTALETAIAQLEEYDPEWESKERGECECLRLVRACLFLHQIEIPQILISFWNKTLQEIAQLTARQDALEKNNKAVMDRRDALIGAVKSLKGIIIDSEAEIAALENDISEVQSDMAKDGDTIVNMLKKIAPVYNSLYKAAKDALIPLPSEAIASISKPSPAPFKYDPARFGTYNGEWHNFTGDDFVIATALPDDNRMQTLISPSIRDIEEIEKEEEDHEDISKQENEIERNGKEEEAKEGGKEEENVKGTKEEGEENIATLQKQDEDIVNGVEEDADTAIKESSIINQGTNTVKEVTEPFAVETTKQEENSSVASQGENEVSTVEASS